MGRQPWSVIVVLRSVSWIAVIGFAGPVVADFLAPSLGPSFADSSVHRYDATGNEILSGGMPFLPNFAAGRLGFSQGVTIGPDGNIYLSSNNLLTGAGEILFFDPTGAPLSHDGGEPGLFATLPWNPPIEEGGDPVAPSPAGLTFGPDGNLYVADRQGTTVRVFDGQTGQQLADAATDLVSPTGIAFGPDGALYVTNFNTATVERIVAGVKDPTPFISLGTPGVNTPTSLLWLPSGHVLVVDVIGNKVDEFDGTGAFVRTFAVPPPPIPANWQELATFPTNSPSQIIFDEDGNLVLGLLGLTNSPTDDGALLRYSLEGGDPLETIATGLPGVAGLAFIKPADAIDADYNSDGAVNVGDYLKWKNDYGKWVARGGGADGNGDGIVDGGDYVYWRNRLPAEVVAGGDGVPEPSAGALCVLGTLAALAAMRRGY